MATGDQPKVKWLAPIVEIRPKELGAALVSLAWIFLALCAYYMIKPIRGQVLQDEALIGVNNKPLVMVATVLFTGVFAWAYGRIVAGVPRRKLIVWTYLVFVACVVAFAVLLRGKSAAVGYVFYVWVSTFNVMVVSQFWALAADVWSKEEGKRLFAFIGLGTVWGGVAGATLTTFAEKLAAWQMLFGCAAILSVCLGLALVLLRLRSPAAASTPAPSETEAKQDAPAESERPNALTMVLGSPFLRLIAVMTLMLNLVNSNNEWIFDRLLHDQDLPGGEVRAYYGAFYLVQNILTVVIQTFITGRIQRRYGARVALFFLPLIGILGGTWFLALPSLLVIRWEKILENSTDYSIQSNTRELLYLPTTKLEKYAAKNVNDTFVVRLGDLLSAGSIALAVNLVIPAFGSGLGLKSLVTIDLVLGLAWLAVVSRLGRLHAQRMEGVGPSR